MWGLRRKRVGAAGTLLLAGAIAMTGLGASAAPAASAPETNALLTKVTAAHHPGYDRVVFTFNKKRPPQFFSNYVRQLYQDGSGERILMPGSAIYQIAFWGTDAHTATGKPTVAPPTQAWALPNVIKTVDAGDFEGIVTYGVALSRKTSVKITRLSNPYRLVFDFATPYRLTTAKVYFADNLKAQRGVQYPVTAVSRSIPSTGPGVSVLDRLFVGPTPAELRRGLRLYSSGATGYTRLSISSDGIARVHLVGGCQGGSAVINIADQIRATLRQFRTVKAVKVYDPAGNTRYPNWIVDSNPECLEP